MKSIEIRDDPSSWNRHVEITMTVSINARADYPIWRVLQTMQAECQIVWLTDEPPVAAEPSPPRRRITLDEED